MLYEIVWQNQILILGWWKQLSWNWIVQGQKIILKNVDSKGGNIKLEIRKEQRATGKGFAGTNGRPQESQNSKIANCATLKRQLHFLPHKTKTQKLAGISDRTTIENLSNQVKKSKSETLCSSYLAMARTNVFGPSCIIFIWTHVRIWLFLYCICMFIFLYLEEHFRMSRFNFFPVRGTECLNRI